MHHRTKFCQNRSSGLEISQFFIFKIDFLSAFLDHIRSIFGGLYWCAKFGRNPYSSFDNMKVLNILRLTLKCLFTPQNYGFSRFSPLNGEVY